MLFEFVFGHIASVRVHHHYTVCNTFNVIAVLILSSYHAALRWFIFLTPKCKSLLVAGSSDVFVFVSLSVFSFLFILFYIFFSIAFSFFPSLCLIPFSFFPSFPIVLLWRSIFIYFISNTCQSFLAFSNCVHASLKYIILSW